MIFEMVLMIAVFSLALGAVLGRWQAHRDMGG
jgi:cytochrome oxidase assembly protein ShyY1